MGPPVLRIILLYFKWSCPIKVNDCKQETDNYFVLHNSTVNNDFHYATYVLLSAAVMSSIFHIVCLCERIQHWFQWLQLVCFFLLLQTLKWKKCLCLFRPWIIFYALSFFFVFFLINDTSSPGGAACLPHSSVVIYSSPPPCCRTVIC